MIDIPKILQTETKEIPLKEKQTTDKSMLKYAENVLKTEDIQIQVLKGLAEKENIKTILEKTLEIISILTDNKVFKTQAMTYFNDNY